ncbi:uncharacterized protein [Venturia canescens]|uniref:uncharacterized protein n=1 Tax=Venturia canescens TaxID=32260 RepID=UPI001C9C4866|nr:uncharacterized protein LOC122408217 [Venturia canescens]
MLRARLFKLWESVRKRPRLFLLGAPCLLVLTLYFVSGKELEFEGFLSLRAYPGGDEIADGYLVWNPKCHMISKDPLDWTIKKYVTKYKFEACSSEPLISNVTRDPLNGSVILTVNTESTETRKRPTCCWSPISRPAPPDPPTGDWDSKITVGKCIELSDRVILSPEIETVMVTCRRGKTTIYKNIHAIINPAKVQQRLTQVDREEDEASSKEKNRKLSILMLGIDSVSRLNFKRALPKTEKYLREKDWFHLQGYNKMGENTFPNLMAILTGMNNADAYAKCKPTVPYGLDNCPMLWYEFRNSGYVTAYGEEVVTLSTFNYHKVGFVEPPTDYYLRPYTVAAEKLLKAKKRFGSKYCTGPEVSVERIFNYAFEFARTFMGFPYFGFFWTNSVSHEDLNGVSSMDDRLRYMFEKMENEAITNDTMIIFLSDHGMRWGGIRQTFVGWYEERLPFIYVKIPHWFRQREPNAYEAMRLNENRLTSPYDIYETLRDILIRAGGSVNASTGCPTCQTLFNPVPQQRGCSDAGILPHWCTCMAFKTASTNDKIALEGTRKFLQHIENIIKHYRDKNGKRICSKLKLKKIHRVDKVIDLRGYLSNATLEGYFYLIEVSPGGGLYETTIHYHGADNFTINEDEISRINSYASSSTCLDHGSKRYCHCIHK